MQNGLQVPVLLEVVAGLQSKFNREPSLEEISAIGELADKAVEEKLAG